jgi:uncharacterized protein YPO0396
MRDMQEKQGMHEVQDMPDRQEKQLSLDLSSAADQLLPGFRLSRLEVYNWGTFDGAVFKLHLDGRNGLLTGDIGSGKSTLVDALTTLLVPAHKVAYNKAAGADSRERSLKSYVLGYYRSERSESSASAKPVGLRDNSQFSVILGVFKNAGYDFTVSLAQVFWIKDGVGTPARLFVGAESDLSIAQDFSNFGSDISSLKKRLSQKCELFDSFPKYSAWFKRRLAIEHDQALELFHQTVSMKSVGNLTDFVRTHMLQAFDVESRIQDLVGHYDNLTKAHEAVLKAARQVELLTPLIANCHRRAQLAAARDELQRSREATPYYFARLKHSLLGKKIEQLKITIDHQIASTKKLDEAIKRLREEESNLRVEIAANGGTLIEQLARDIEHAESERDRRLDSNKRYAELCRSVSLAPSSTEDAFISQKHHLQTEVERTQQEETIVQTDLNEFDHKLRQLRSEYDELKREIESLKQRRSNIPHREVSIRERLCQALNLPESDVPFAGELLQVREEDAAWEGAAERLLRNFGLSILVPDKYYAQVADWVDANDLKGRIGWFRVRARAREAFSQFDRPSADSLATKISIKTASPYYEWLENEVARRADVICCETSEDFRRESKAITRAGQIKKPGDRHEKDDRYRIDDRNRYVLGWSNQAKLEALQRRALSLENDILDIAQKLSKCQSKMAELRTALKNYARLEEVVDFRQIDWQSVSKEIEQLKQTKKELETASDVLAKLKERLDLIIPDIKEKDQALVEMRDKRSKNEQKLADYLANRADIDTILADPENARHLDYFELLETQRAENFAAEELTLENAERAEQKLRAWLRDRIESEEGKLSRVSGKIVEAMTSFNKDYPGETQEFDAAVESAHEYERKLEELQADDLPRFRATFKELLNENTIREVANFQSQLNKERETIRERIDQINESLTKIDYNKGRYIILDAEASRDNDIRDFQLQLQSCTEGTLVGSDDEQYSEAKFLQVQRIIERFRGRVGSTEADQRWTARVTDVRNWFNFAASERDRESGNEFEHYSDSGGKSGGQKEKLAYTILAASLAYQFGIEWGASRSRKFRFVVIDEAFGRGSDDSAQYGLQLFSKLDIQLLVVTPMQKTNIIEPFVSSVGFVQNDEGKSSKILCLSIKEYRELKANGQRLDMPL